MLLADPGGDNGVTRGKARCVVADRNNLAGGVDTGDHRQRERFIRAVPKVGINRVDRRAVDGDEYLIGFRFGTVDLICLEYVGVTVTVESDGVHIGWMGGNRINTAAE
jgi:hypothetical protein